jgi:hypothetical protein
VFSFAFILIYKYKFLRVIKEQLLIMVILWCEKTMRWWNKWKQDYFLKTSCGVGASEASQILDHDGTSNTWYLVNAGLILNIQSGICSNSLHAQFAKLTWDLVRGYPYTRVCQSPESCVPGMALSFVTVARKRKRQWRGSVTHEVYICPKLYFIPFIKSSSINNQIINVTFTDSSSRNSGSSE